MWCLCFFSPYKIMRVVLEPIPATLGQSLGTPRPYLSNLGVWNVNNTSTVLWRFPGTSPITGTPSNICLQQKLEPRSLCVSAQPPIDWTHNTPYNVTKPCILIANKYTLCYWSWLTCWHPPLKEYNSDLSVCASACLAEMCALWVLFLLVEVIVFGTSECVCDMETKCQAKWAPWFFV